jgi:hypothetical protein
LCLTLHRIEVVSYLVAYIFFNISTLIKKLEASNWKI